MISNAMYEQRKHERFPINAVIIITNSNNGKIYSGICCNVSAEGLLINSPDDIPLDEPLYIEVSERDAVFVGNGSVVRKHMQGDEFIIGIKIDFNLLEDD